MNETIQPNKSSALIALGITKMTEGKLVTIKYINSFGHLDFIVALGTGEGYGPDYFTLLSDHSRLVVTRIITSLPDISEAVFGEIFLLKEEGKFYRCHFDKDNHEWAKEEISGDHILTCLEDSWLYLLRADEGILERLSFNFSSGGGGGNINWGVLEFVTDNNVYRVKVVPVSYYYGGETSGIGNWDIDLETLTDEENNTALA